MKKGKTAAIFIGHGSPMSAISDNIYGQAWKKLGHSLPKPKAILVISAHWNIDEVAVSNVLEPRQIYDFYGFPEELYNIKYSPVGSPDLAARVVELLTPLTEVKINNEWGIDHGAWIPLHSLFPQADLPVVQLSLDYSKSPEFHYQVGKTLRILREEGIMIIGSGDIVHNLSVIEYEENAAPYDWAKSFEEKVISLIAKKDHKALIDYLNISPESKLAIPTPEHYLPLLYILGLQDDDELNYFVSGIAHGSISMTSFILN
ncbi:MAG: 4,5-DOPA dioxygenase extradiol [Candidatus Falkowbacteria bacterium]